MNGDRMTCAAGPKGICRECPRHSFLWASRTNSQMGTPSMVRHSRSMSSHRTFRDELIHALQRHLQFPPVVVIEGKDLQDS